MKSFNRLLIAGIFAMLISSIASAQLTPPLYDSTKNLTLVNATGNHVKELRVAGALWMPQDTFHLARKDSGAIAYKSGNIYKWNGYLWLDIGGGLFDATVDFSVNANPNTVGTTFSPNTPHLSTVIYVSTINGSQWTWNGSAYVIYTTFEWSVLGNAGTNSATNFLGTTDGVGLKFRVGNLQSGFLDITDHNTSFGYKSMRLASGSISYNTAIGEQALENINGGGSNTATGYQSMLANAGGSNNTATGYGSLLENTSGGTNVAVGKWSGQHNTSGSSNVFVGVQAGQNNTTGYNNTFIGYQAGSSATTQYANTVVGAGITGTAGMQGQMYLGNGIQSFIHYNQTGGADFGGGTTWGSSGDLLQSRGQFNTPIWASPGSLGLGTVTSFSSGNLSPLFTTSVATASTTPAQTFSLSNAGAYTLFGRGASTGAPSFLSSIDSNWIPTLHSENYYNTKYLAAGSGVTTIGTFSASSIANGASISGHTLTLGVGDGTNPGMISTTTQTIAGAKTFTSDMLLSESAPLLTLKTTANGTSKIAFVNSSGTEYAAWQSSYSGGETRFSNSSGGYFMTWWPNGAEAMRLGINNNLMLGGTTETAKLSVLKTTEQLRLQYDASNYASFTTNSAGNLSIVPTGGIINPSIATHLGKDNAGGNTQQLIIGHNGTTSSSSDGISSIKFASQYGNYPFTMGAEGNGYSFVIRQTNGGQGTFQWDFGTISSVPYTRDFLYSTDHYEDILNGKWLTAFSGSGSGGAYYGFRNSVLANGSGTKYDAFRIERPINLGYYQVSDDPLLSLFSGSSTATITAHNRYVARFNRLGFLGIGTTNDYSIPQTEQQAAITINQGSKTGTTTSTGTTAMQVKTTGSSTAVVCVGNGNGENAMGLIVGSKITANGLTRTITQVNSSQNFTVDAAVNWDNSGAGYNFTYRNPYIALIDSATKYFIVDGTGNTGIGVAPAKLFQIGTVDPLVSWKQATTGQEYTASIGTGSGISSQVWALKDVTNNKYLITASNNRVIIGNPTSAYSSSTVYVKSYTSSGTNVDLQADTALVDESNDENMDADYSNGNGIARRYWGNVGVAGSYVMGYAKKNLALYELNGRTTNAINVKANRSLRIGTNDIERFVIDSIGGLKANNYGSGTFIGTPTKSLNVDASGNIIEGPVSVLAQTTDRQTAQTGTVTLAAATVGASDASYLISANLLVTTSTLHNFTATVSYTDEGNTARVVTMQFSTLAGAFVTAMTNAQGTVPYEGVPLHIRAKASTTITLATTGTFTGVTYNFEESIRQIN